MNTEGTANSKHAGHLAHMKTLAKAQDRRDYVAKVKRDDGRFFSEWLVDDFTTWWATRNQKESAA